MYVTDTAYNSKQILVMEKTILGNLEWYLTVPTQYVFLVRFIKASVSDPEVSPCLLLSSELCYNNVDWKETNFGFVVLYHVDGEHGSLSR